MAVPQPGKIPKWREKSPMNVKYGAKRVSFSMRQVLPQTGNTLPRSMAWCLSDKHHAIERGKVFPVCGNTWRMLKDTRFAPYFTFIGDFSRHFGIFPGCGTAMPFDAGPALTSTDAACC